MNRRTINRLFKKLPYVDGDVTRLNPEKLYIWPPLKYKDGIYIAVPPSLLFGDTVFSSQVKAAVKFKKPLFRWKTDTYIGTVVLLPATIHDLTMMWLEHFTTIELDEFLEKALS